jgi:hypothetical protein
MTVVERATGRQQSAEQVVAQCRGERAIAERGAVGCRQIFFFFWFFIQHHREF